MDGVDRVVSIFRTDFHISTHSSMRFFRFALSSIRLFVRRWHFDFTAFRVRFVVFVVVNGEYAHDFERHEASVALTLNTIFRRTQPPVLPFKNGGIELFRTQTNSSGFKSKIVCS